MRSRLLLLKATVPAGSVTAPSTTLAMKQQWLVIILFYINIVCYLFLSNTIIKCLRVPSNPVKDSCIKIIFVHNLPV